jgi:hypothetical protein
VITWLHLRLLQAKAFVLQLACKRTQFSACGFFRLNLALIRPVRNPNTNSSLLDHDDLAPARFCFAGSGRHNDVRGPPHAVPDVRTVFQIEKGTGRGSHPCNGIRITIIPTGQNPSVVSRPHMQLVKERRVAVAYFKALHRQQLETGRAGSRRSAGPGEADSQSARPGVEPHRISTGVLSGGKASHSKHTSLT